MTVQPDPPPTLPAYRDTWPADDPHANFKEEVALHTTQDPTPMFVNLSRLTGIPVGALMRYALVKYGSEGTEALLHAGPRLIRRMAAITAEAEQRNTTAGRLEAYEQLRQIVSWLQVPLDDPGWVEDADQAGR
ncbi:DUF6027 family protein [Euzebya tangerina]|uniref:DUF6027 family protein n=1 Tax=Euzebya tangerina TaxID=591198 RepID=UPI000E30D9B7|nr:DUF6027 family protein [Euzebya tangerina]